MILSIKDYRSKVLGCWMGKNIGGTLGAPMEWKRQVNDITFYTQDLGGNPLPNDDLDLQLVWLAALEEKGLDINARTLGEYWLLYITPHWAEYGNGKINMRSGLMPPLSGTENNPYKGSCGAFIRSEIWACIAPGCPEVAVRYAYEDAIVDHGNGEGMYAELFCAAMESAAFVEKDIETLISIGLSYIAEDCAVAKVIRLALESYHAGKPYLEVRDDIFTQYRAHVYYCNGVCCTISEEDQVKGFADGPIGWDVPANIGFLLIGLLYGEGDFGKTLCAAVNCGEDTDCTGATLGALWGIMHGFEAIPQEWIDPIGHGIQTCCVNLGELPNQVPKDIESLTNRVERIARQATLRFCPDILLSDILDSEVPQNYTKTMFSRDTGVSVYSSANGPLYKFDTISVLVDYLEGPYIRNNTPKKIKFTIRNSYKTAESLNLKLYADDGWGVAPSKQMKLFVGQLTDNPVDIEFTFASTNVPVLTNRFVMELTTDGKHTVMLVPIVLLNRG